MQRLSKYDLTRSSLLTLILTGVLGACASDTPDVRISSSTVLNESAAMARGKEHFSAGRYGLALAEFRTAVANAPMSIETLNALAATYDQIQRFDLADTYYQRALTQAPESAQTLNNVGYSYMLRGKFDVASAYLREAKRVDSLNATVTANLQMVSPDIFTTEVALDLPESNDSSETPLLLNVSTDETIQRELVRVKPEETTIVETTIVTAIGRSNHQSVNEGLISVAAERTTTRSAQYESKIHLLVARNHARATEDVTAPVVALAVRGRTPDRTSFYGTTEVKLTGQVAAADAVEPITHEIGVRGSVSDQAPRVGTTSVDIIGQAPAAEKLEVSTQQLEINGSASARKPIFAATDVVITSEMPETGQPEPVTHQIAVRGSTSTSEPLVGTIDVGRSMISEATVRGIVPQRVSLLGAAAVSLTGMPSPSSDLTHNIAMTAPPPRAEEPVKANEAEIYPPMPTPSAAPLTSSPTRHAAVYEVSNGAGRLSMAARMQTYLAGNGLTVARLTNASRFSHMQSTIFYKQGWKAQAQLLASQLPLEVALIETTELTADIKLELGGDLLKFDENLYYGRGI